jgi:energy-coupling factor transporter ATP-binding protein EcfA2
MYKSFRHGTRTLEVLRGVNLTLRAREMVTIIGASGAGKSTLLHCLGTLDLPTAGEILFHPLDGGTPTDITRLPPPDLAEFRNRTIAWLAQIEQRWQDAANEIDRARAAFGDKARCGDHTPQLLKRFAKMRWEGPAAGKVETWLDIVENANPDESVSSRWPIAPGAPRA